jgi:para-nitrobenzyl esterase
MRLLLVLACTWCGFAQNDTAVRIESGKITGRETGQVRAWLGIPYAAPPVGDWRWRPPQPPPRWEGVRAMDHVGAACIQAALGPLGTGGLPQSEDCLTLNVWAPANARQAAVMFWIHGGAFVEGSGGLAIYNGAALARQGVVVVTINYRLGPLGFFAYPGLNDESGEPAANFGIMDQIAALGWVRRNIAAFGGDPHNVTAWGQSAGAMSVYDLMTSGPARGLFARAIAESGPILGPLRTLAQAQRSGEQRAREWGAEDLKALRALPARAFNNAGLRDAGPVIDGKYLSEEPRQAFAEGRQAPVPFLLGANSFEASLMGIFPGLAGRLSAMLDENGRAPYSGGAQARAEQLFTDAGFLEPTRFLAGQMAKVAQPAWLYYFSFLNERRRARAPGVMHGGEIPFVFDNVTAGALALIATPEDRQMAQTVSGYWVAFARTGNPNGGGRPDWPGFEASTDKLLDLGPRVEVRQDFRKPQLDYIEQVLAALLP